ncbi:Bacterial nodulin-like intrinsic protein [Brevundimonas diminuta]|jgi:aquaporin Z|uniref:aquaporin n=1 Tax=Brevundimonas diminuta TaxID=293 RepID=UPI000207F7E4|nr:aquaporin [Brevundimonas diminuta]EGF94687.1 aquaporin Z [Brevundimonas diminuta ATCC 11568]OWR21784.1 aquaporin [Brevundimonas diminuta]WQE46538.1 aquaporin [Brevundimonas diminuta]SPU48005.1 Bacterial nodulin-like intrinsic protein [Brevundimonas diminuta]SUW15791.1 Bacterial nodulin-like intrinsic protein [Brevundimonas diminuta]
MVKKFAAELVGTLVLVLFGCGAAVLGGFDHVGQLGIALAFGFAIVAMAYGIGPISGCHVNPAVSLGAFVAGRMSAKDMVVYWIAQFIGAILGAAILGMIAKTGFTSLGQNGFDAGSPGGYGLHAALVFEVVATAIFLIAILGVTGVKGHGAFAGVAIGITLAVIHIVGIQVTGVSVNPARSFGPALLVGGQALSQVWVFFVAPAIGAVIGGLLFRSKLLEPDA